MPSPSSFPPLPKLYGMTFANSSPKATPLASSNSTVNSPSSPQVFHPSPPISLASKAFGTNLPRTTSTTPVLVAPRMKGGSICNSSRGLMSLSPPFGTRFPLPTVCQACSSVSQAQKQRSLGSLHFADQPTAMAVRGSSHTSSDCPPLHCT